MVRGNTVIGSRIAGIVIEHGSDNTLEANVLLGGRIGNHGHRAGRRWRRPSRGHRIDDNVVGGVEQGIVLQGTGGQPGARQPAGWSGATVW